MKSVVKPDKGFERNEIYWRKTDDEKKRLKRLKARTPKFKYSSSNTKLDKTVVTLRYHVGKETFNVTLPMYKLTGKVNRLKSKHKNAFKLSGVYLKRPR